MRHIYNEGDLPKKSTHTHKYTFTHTCTNAGTCKLTDERVQKHTHKTKPSTLTHFVLSSQTHTGEKIYIYTHLPPNYPASKS